MHIALGHVHLAERKCNYFSDKMERITVYILYKHRIIT